MNLFLYLQKKTIMASSNLIDTYYDDCKEYEDRIIYYVKCAFKLNLLLPLDDSVSIIHDGEKINVGRAECVPFAFSFVSRIEPDSSDDYVIELKMMVVKELGKLDEKIKAVEHDIWLMGKYKK